MGKSDRKNQNHILHFIHEKSFFLSFKKKNVLLQLIYNVQVYSRVNQLCVYIYLFFFGLPRHH